MFTPTISVRKINKNLIIKWQLSHFTIPLEDILEVTEDDTYGGKEVNAIRIGPPYGTTDRIFIKTTSKNYLLFTSNAPAILNEIHS
ncbi:hypothetical protein ABIC37_004559 [Priestia megaterium]|uniref:SunI/YnzG family protein n=1 Tax=Priestia megaterium TaxID=1404 RepID=UPI000E2F0914|nr:hypothetical protein [Priestia megaterium]TCN10663.1 hypothetical protein EV581_10452 [Bacillus sp. BK006]MCM3018539.1 hypothetical protein [Priestia megaterium]MCM3184655.1 hypothetical protein [Priestia megaterium]MCM3195427.1 hypothetical protein [Priestia megaterium]MED3917231.1 hypothetical protein [Priestia megaterium]